MDIVPGMKVATARIQETRVNYAYPPEHVTSLALCFGALVHSCITSISRCSSAHNCLSVPDMTGS